MQPPERAASPTPRAPGGLPLPSPALSEDATPPRPPDPATFPAQAELPLPGPPEAGHTRVQAQSPGWLGVGVRGGSLIPDTGRQGRGGSLPGWGDLAGLHPAPRQRPPFSGQDRTGSPTRHPLQAPLCPLPRPARPPLPPGGAGVGDRPDRGLEAIGADPRSPRLGAASRHHTQNPALPRGLRGPGPGCPTPGPGCPADIQRLVGLDAPLPQSSWPPTSVRTGPHPPLHRTWLCLPPAPTPAPLTAGLTPPQGRRPRAPGLFRTSAWQPAPQPAPPHTRDAAIITAGPGPP